SAMHERPTLDRAALERLRAIARAIHRDDGRSAPLEHLVRLAREVRLDAGVTIDLEASRDLGGPLLIVRLPDRDGRPGCMACLPPREREVPALLAEGLSNKQVARRLAITLATVKDHVHRILHKTGLPNRTAVATAWNGRPPAG